MKKIALLLGILIISTECVNASDFGKGFIDKLKFKPSNQERLAPVKDTYEDGMSPSEQAVALYNDNNPKAALEKILSINEGNRTAQDWLLLGNILQDQNKINDAAFMYQRAINTDPKFYKPYFNLANIYLEQEKPYLAIENYRKANKLNPEFAYAYYNLGCAYLKAGDLKRAKIVFLKAIEIKNTDANFHYNLAYTYKMLNNAKLAKQYLGFYNKLIENAQ